MTLAMLLSGAWWAQKLGGFGAKVVAVTLAIAGVALLVGIGFWLVRADARQDERAQCNIESVTAEVEALRSAAQQQEQTLRIRARALEASEAFIKQLEAEKEKLRNATPNPDAVVVPPGTAWLRWKSRAAPALERGGHQDR